jgi:hypothetical protein
VEDLFSPFHSFTRTITGSISVQAAHLLNVISFGCSGCRKNQARNAAEMDRAHPLAESVSMNNRFHALGCSILIAISLAMVATISGNAHTPTDADGSTVSWYPLECCNNGDCRPVASVNPTPQGLLMTTVDGYVVIVGETQKRRPSRDNRWHVCLGEDIAEEANPPHVRCIFEPPNA